MSNTWNSIGLTLKDISINQYPHGLGDISWKNRFRGNVHRNIIAQ